MTKLSRASLTVIEHVCRHECSVVSDSVTPWTAAHQAPLSMGFSRQECWSGLSFPSPGDPPNPWVEPKEGRFFTTHHLEMVLNIALTL